MSGNHCERLDYPAVCYRADYDSAPTSVGVGPRTGCSTLGGTATRAFPSEEEESRIARFSPGKWGPRSGVKQSALISHRLVSLAWEHSGQGLCDPRGLRSVATAVRQVPRGRGLGTPALGSGHSPALSSRPPVPRRDERHPRPLVGKDRDGSSENPEKGALRKKS